MRPVAGDAVGAGGVRRTRRDHQQRAVLTSRSSGVRLGLCTTSLCAPSADELWDQIGEEERHHGGLQRPAEQLVLSWQLLEWGFRGAELLFVAVTVVETADHVELGAIMARLVVVEFLGELDDVFLAREHPVHELSDLLVNPQSG
jgi:hypothetical protein